MYTTGAGRGTMTGWQDIKYETGEGEKTSLEEGQFFASNT